MSVNINIHNAVKRYGSNTIIPNLSLNIKNREFFTLLGPSGCGKTTLLRMIAGFNTIEGGDFYFNETKINDLEPSKRNIGMVFQNYAIFPNLSVRKNIEFGLKYKNMDKETMKSEAEKFMQLVQVDQYAERMPDRLSGGQQQRIALARALVIQPDVLLMDEPLSNLDAKLRVEMRTAIKELQREVGITTVYVTHDQEEAMAVSDRIAVMSEGVIHQCAKPYQIYQRPIDLFVATFIGKTNLLEATLKVEDGKGSIVFENGYTEYVDSLDTNLIQDNLEVTLSVRPEEFIIHNIQDQNTNGLRGKVYDSVFLGINTHYFVNLENGTSVEVIQVSKVGEILEPGTEIVLSMDVSKINVYDRETTTSLMTDVYHNLEGDTDET